MERLVEKGEALMVVESEGTKARLQSTQKQLALFRYENQLFNMLLIKSGRFDLNALPEPPEINSFGRSYPFCPAYGARNIRAIGVVENSFGISCGELSF